MAAIPLKHDDVYYPESDGRPMAETDLHREVMTDLIHGLKRRYAEAPDVYVGGNLLFYDVQGNPRSSFSPDVFLVKGVPPGRRRIFKLWEEGKVPCLVFEITSDSTHREDEAKKMRYQRLGVEELVLFDPLGVYLDPQLQGYRLDNGVYRPLKPNPDGSLTSQTTGLLLRVEGEKLRLIDAASGEKLLWLDEIDAHLDQANARAARAEEELARLRRELEERNRS
ncbi:MAG: Uma2 family endonuclease [Thermoanaerobaculia bacterium]